MTTDKKRHDLEKRLETGFAKELEKCVTQELKNLAKNSPVFPGDTLSHGTAEECVNRGWARRTSDGNFHITVEGQEQLEKAND